MPKYSIGIVTYINRYEEFFVPLVKQLERVFPDVEKNYVLNGFYDQGRQQKYLAGAKKFLAGTSASSVIAYDEHQSLAKCWNRLVINSQADRILIMNDDVRISRLFRWMLEPQVGRFDTAVINGSWSHFVITKDVIRKIGWFDERLAGVGFEDADYGLRLALAAGQSQMPRSYLHSLFCLGIKNIVVRDADPGWKKISGVSSGKYAKINRAVLHQKWQFTEKPRQGALFYFHNRYVTLNPGMETPKFYDYGILDKP